MKPGFKVSTMALLLHGMLSFHVLMPSSVPSSDLRTNRALQKKRKDENEKLH
jgi:hypothetical protein